MDVFIGNRARPVGGYPSTLFVQRGDCTFSDQGKEMRFDGNGVVLAVPADFDGDGRLDLFLSGYRRDNTIVLGSHDRFKAGTAPLPDALRKTRAEDVLIADFNGDALSDVWLVTRITRKGKGGHASLFLNTSSGFVDASKESGAGDHPFNSRNATAGDFDNDGDIDVYEVNGNYRVGFIGENLPNVVWENVSNTETLKGNDETIPTPVFVPHTGPGFAPGDDNGLGDTVAMGELNGDGFLDLIVANGAGHGRDIPSFFTRGTYDLYLGPGVGRNVWLMVNLVGTVSNTEGIGGIVRATANGSTHLRTAKHGVHNRTQNDPRLHFGFGAINPDEKVTLDISWPSGIRQVVDAVSLNQVVEIIEPDTGRKNEIPGGRPR